MQGMLRLCFICMCVCVSAVKLEGRIGMLLFARMNVLVEIIFALAIRLLRASFVSKK